MTKEERIAETTKLFTETLEHYQTANFGFDQSILKRLEENIGFYTGVGQWPEDVKQQLRAEYRPALVINRCAPMVNMVSGFERQNRTEIKPYAFESGDAAQAFVMEYVLKHVHRYYDSAFSNSEGFLKGIVSSEANWEYSIDFGDDGYPTLERELLPIGSVLWDPRSLRYDRKDAMYCIHNSWIGLDELMQLSPKADQEKIEMVDGSDNMGLHHTSSLDQYRMHLKSMNNGELYDEASQKVRLVRVWRKRWEKEFILYDKQNPSQVQRLSEKEMRGIDIENPTFTVHPRMRAVFSHHMISGNEELDYVDNIKLTRIPIIPFYCFYIEGTYFSLIDLAKDRQMQINKTDSVMMDYLSRLPKLAAMAEESAFANDTDRHRFDRAKVGDSFVFADGALREGKVVFPNVRGLEIISYYTALKQQQNMELKETVGATDTLQGIKPKAADSGVALDILRSQGMTIIEPILDNYYRTKRLMGALEIEMIQKFFPPEKVERILGSIGANYRDEKFQAVWQAARDDENERTKLIDTLMSTKYDIVMDEGLNTPTIRQANMAQFNSMMTAGFPVPPDLVIESSAISQDQKDLWKQYIQQQQQMQQQMGQGNG